MPPNDPGFLDMTIEEIEREYYRHYYADNPSKEEFEGEPVDLQDKLRQLENSPDDWEKVL